MANSNDLRGKTYLELLAENDAEARKDFEPNAKDLLTANFVEYDDHVGGHDAHPDELEDQHEFQKPQGSHQAASLMPEAPKSTHTSTTAVQYDKHVQIHVMSIDSRFRTDQGDNPSNFLFKLLTPIKNVISIRLSSLEIPNTWYTFSKIRGNISMVVTIYPGVGTGIATSTITNRVLITEGNYAVNNYLPNDILIELYKQLNSSFPGVSFSVLFSAITGKITISCFTNTSPPSGGYTYLNQASAPTESPINFSINFADGIFSTRDNNWGLGFNLGFRSQQVGYITDGDLVSSITGDAVVDVIDANYVFLSLNPDWKVVEHNQPDRAQTAAFAKIIVDVPKNDIVYDTGSNTVTKQYFMRQPTNITAFNISIVDEYEQYVQLQGGNVSMSLEVTEVLHSSLYESMRT
uniref:Uncharacterized protein n=1 Tax=viral metagenome TaxID=1070528 RepID=A0A6C0B3P8_9ZZZZ